jgi:hypothetical protein
VVLGCVGVPMTVSRVAAAPYEPEFLSLGLTATMDAPAEAVAGVPFDYVVTLTNTTAQAVRLSPCLNYSQYVKVEATAEDQHALNCSAAGPISAGGSESFRMHLTMPAAASGTTELVWRLHTGGPETIYAAATVRVAPAP